MKGQPFKKIGGILKKVAPKLLVASTGGAAPLAMTIAKQVLGDQAITDDELENQVASMTNTTEGLAKLREIDAALKQAEMDNGFKFEELATRNTEGARAMAIAQGLGPQKVIATLYLGGYFTTLIVMLVLAAKGVSFDDSVLELIKTLMTAFSIGVPIILQFFFGSSAGSKHKDIALASGAAGG